MSKYEGINKVQVSLNEAENEKKTNKKSGGFFTRIIFAMIILAVPFSLKLIKSPVTERAVETIKEAVLYDMSNRGQNPGEVRFIELIKSLLK